MSQEYKAPAVRAIVQAGIKAGMASRVVDQKLIAQKVCERSKIKARTVSFDLTECTPESLFGLAAQGAELLFERVIAVDKDDALTQKVYDQKIDNLLARMRGEVEWGQTAKPSTGSGRTTPGSAGFSAERAGLSRLVNALLTKQGVKKPTDEQVSKAIETAKAHPKLKDFVAKAQAEHDAIVNLSASFDLDI